MTRTEFIAVLRRINPDVELFLKARIELPRVCDMLAIDCFVNQVREDDDTDTFRYQLRHLQRHGKFDLEE